MSADYTQMIAAAEQRSERRDWSEAARTYEAAAELAARTGRVEQAWRAWRSAGECWRRDDQPVAAQRCLRRALELTEPSGSAAAATVPSLAAVLGDAGRAEVAEDLLESIAAEQRPGALSPAFVDVRAGLLIGLGRKEAARVHVAALRAMGASGESAARFRDAQLLAYDGELTRARTAWRRMIVALHRAEELAGLGAALGALAEVELLLGAEREALDRFQASAEAWRSAGRLAPAWSAEAGRVRAMVALGIHPLPGLLDEGIAFAEDRGFVPLATSLRLARGVARADRDAAGARDDLDRALIDAMSSGATLLVGHAAFESAVRLCLPETTQQNLLETAAMAFVSHVPYAARVAVARARLLARYDAAQARTVARSCVPLLDRMGMARDLVSARALVRTLG